MSSLKLFLKILDIHPDVERRFNEVSLVLVNHDRGVASRCAQGLTEPMDRYVEAVASSVGRYFGPEHAHQSIPPHLAVTVEEKVLKHCAASPRRPDLDRAVLKSYTQFTKHVSCHVGGYLAHSQARHRRRREWP